MEKEVTFERSTSVGTKLRITVEPLEQPFVRIVAYYRKPKQASQFKRAKQEEGAVVSFEQLGVDETFEDFFAPQEAA